MVNPMRRHPKNRPTLERQSSADSQEILQHPRQLVGSMGVQAVITHTYPQTDPHPIKHGCRQQEAPAKHKKGGKGPEMQYHQNDSDGPIQFLVVVDTNNVAAHEISNN